jgi:hypothetical protein
MKKSDTRLCRTQKNIVRGTTRYGNYSLFADVPDAAAAGFSALFSAGLSADFSAGFSPEAASVEAADFPFSLGPSPTADFFDPLLLSVIYHPLPLK